MDHISISKKKEPTVKVEVAEDKLKVYEDIKNLVFNSVYQNSQIKFGVYFITEDDLEGLPTKITQIVDTKLGE